MTDNIIHELKSTVITLYSLSKEQVEEYNLSKLMMLIEGRDMTLYNQFKLKLRTNGYII